MIKKRIVSLLILLVLMININACNSSNSDGSHGKSDAQSVTNDKMTISFDIIKNENISENSIISNLNLPQKGDSGCIISWASSNENIISINGIVTRPLFETGDIDVILTAIITKGDSIESKSFNLVVLQVPATDIQAVDEDKKNLVFNSFKDQNIDENKIESDLNLPLKGASGTLFSWESSIESIISKDGKVVRPAYGEGDLNVVLTATITKGFERDIKTFNLTVLENEPSDEQAVIADKKLLTFETIKNLNSDEKNIVGNLTLQKNGLNSTSISWVSDNDDVINQDGVVTRPLFGSADAEVVLTANILKGNVKDSKIFNLIVLQIPPRESEAIEADKEELVFTGFKNENSDDLNIISDLNLPKQGANGTTITWKSSDESIISKDGKVTRPLFGSGNATITLTATFTKESSVKRKALARSDDDKTNTKTFTLIVIQIPPTNAEAVLVNKKDLVFNSVKNTNTSEDNITEDLNLPKSGSYSTSFSWVSSNTEVIAVTGKVKRPTFGSGDAAVTLAVTISRGTTSDVKTFSLRVKDIPPTDSESVAKAKADLVFDDFKNENTDKNDITKDLNFPTSGLNETVISWASSDDAVIGINGKVTRPGFDAGDTDITLTATISKGSENDTKVFNLTVTELQPTDQESVAKDKLNLDFDDFKNSNSLETEITSDLSFPASGATGTTISFGSSDEAVIGTDGKVTRPAFGAGDANITLTATIAKGSESDTKTFNLKVLETPPTDAESVVIDKADLQFNDFKNLNTLETEITTDLSFPTNGLNGTTILFASNDEAVIGTDGKVTRPAFGSGDAGITITATISKGSESDTKTFNLTVIETPPTDAEAVAAAKSDLTFDSIKNTNSLDNEIRTNLNLITAGSYSTTISWASNNDSVITTNGSVTRQNFITGDTNVTITATISSGSENDTKPFLLKVLEDPKVGNLSGLTSVYNPKLVFDSNNNLYLAIQNKVTEDSLTDKSLSVYKLVGNSWVTVGSKKRTFSLSEAPGGGHVHDLVVGSDDNPYIIIRAVNDKANVYYYNGAAWTQKGDADFIDAMNFPHLTLDSTNNPIVFFTNSSGGVDNYANWTADAMSWNGGSWDDLGSIGKGHSNGVFTIGNTPYFLVRLSGRWVYSYSGAWNDLGGKIGDKILRMSFCKDSSDNIYVLAKDDSSSDKATVKTYNSGSWVTVGDSKFSPADISGKTSIASYSGGILYASIPTENASYLYKYDGSSWALKAEFLDEGTDGTSVAVRASDGRVFVAYACGSIYGVKTYK